MKVKGIEREGKGRNQRGNGTNSTIKKLTEILDWEIMPAYSKSGVSKFLL